jgi:hypothetical protein
MGFSSRSNNNDFAVLSEAMMLLMVVAALTCLMISLTRGEGPDPTSARLWLFRPKKNHINAHDAIYLFCLLTMMRNGQLRIKFVD